MLRCLSLGLFAAAIAITPFPLKALEDSSENKVFFIECRGKKTQGSGAAIGFPINHPIVVRYKLDQTTSTLTEIDIDARELTVGKKPFPVEMYGKTVIAKFRNRNLQKDYEIQIRGGERLFSITVYPSSSFEPDAWYGSCSSL